MLNGWKSYIGFALYAVAAIAAPHFPEHADLLDGLKNAALGLAGIGVAHKLAKAGAAKAAAAALLCVALLPGCAGLTPSGMQSPGTAGAPATGTNLAQTVGNDQASVPGTATGGTATINYYMASAVPPATTEAVLKLASEHKWTAEQVEAALRAAAGAPQTVTITGNATNQAGNADNAGAGSGGASGLSGTSGSVQR